MRTGVHTSLGMGVLPFAETDRPDEDDPEVQRIAKSIGMDPIALSNAAEERLIGVFCRTGERPTMDDVLAMIEVEAFER